MSGDLLAGLLKGLAQGLSVLVGRTPEKQGEAVRVQGRAFTPEQHAEKNALHAALDKATVLLLLLALTGCSVFRDKVEYRPVEIERYDPATGLPWSFANVDDSREVWVRYRGKDGAIVRAKRRIDGYDVSPPPLPKPGQTQ
jgi:hypothetical protein